jgi:hypothetical protein
MALPSRRGWQAHNIAVARGHTNPVAASNVDRNPPALALGTTHRPASRIEKTKANSPAGRSGKPHIDPYPRPWPHLVRRFKLSNDPQFAGLTDDQTSLGSRTSSV